MKWTLDNSNAARGEGWDVYDVWDQDTKRMQLEIQRATVPGYFISDEAARAHVQLHQSTDELCAKAWTLVFKSKIPDMKKGKKR